MTGKSLRKIFGLSAGLALAAPTSAMADMGLSSVAAAAPIVIPVGLMATAALWFIMRTMPPKPRQEEFPPTRLLQKWKSTKHKPAEMPLWQRIMRVTAFTLATAGMAQISYNPVDIFKGDGTLLLATNNGAFAGPNWSDRAAAMKDILDRAQRENREVILLPTAPSKDGRPVRAIGPISAAEAARLAQEIEPNPWPDANEQAIAALENIDAGRDAAVIFLDDGLDSPGKRFLIERLGRIGRLTIIEDAAEKKPHLLRPVSGSGGRLAVEVLRPDLSTQETVTLIARDETGHAVGQKKVHLEAGQSIGRGEFDLPFEIINQLTAVSVMGERGAGATLLLDEKTRLRSVGIIEDGPKGRQRSFLSESLYISEALKPRAILHYGSTGSLLDSGHEFSVLVLPDSVRTSKADRDRIGKWVHEGGTLLRFSGPALAAQKGKDADNLLPAGIQPGVRALGGGFSGGKPGRLKEFNAQSPFNGINIPDDVIVKRQILSRPDMVSGTQVWAQLEDNTPLITAAAAGKGQIVLFHSAIDVEWTDMHLSGDLFIDMLHAVIEHSRSVDSALNAENIFLPPLKVLNGRGDMDSPSAFVVPLTAQTIRDNTVGPGSPPGLYGDRFSGAAVARNLYGSVGELKPLPSLPGEIVRDDYGAGKNSKDIAGILLILAMGLAAADYGIHLRQRGMPAAKNKPPPPSLKNRVDLT